MKIIHVGADETERHVQCIKNVPAKYSVDCPYDEWVTERYDDGFDDLIFLNFEVDDETIIEPLVSDLRACECIRVEVFTEANFPGRGTRRTALHWNKRAPPKRAALFV